MRLMILALVFTLSDGLAADSAELLLDPECEAQLALSAGPKHIRESATVYVLNRSGFEVYRKGDGTFHCLVQRNHARSLIPQCMDAEGAQTILPAILDRAREVMSGVPFETSMRNQTEALWAGKYSSPRRPGVNYMLSDYNYIYVAEVGRILHIPAHVMYYAPNLTDEDIGGASDASDSIRGLPSILEEGPHGYMIAYTERASDSTDVIEACPRELLKQPD